MSKKLNWPSDEVFKRKLSFNREELMMEIPAYDDEKETKYSRDVERDL